MTVILLLFVLLLSLIVHVIFLILYVLRRDNIYLRLFLLTALFNFIITILLSFIAMAAPEAVQKIDIQKLLLVLSGGGSTVALLVQVKIIINIFKRSKDPKHYHLNVFGKKVHHGTVVHPYELVLFFGLIPFFIMTGSYFIARLLSIYVL